MYLEYGIKFTYIYVFDDDFDEVVSYYGTWNDNDMDVDNEALKKETEHVIIKDTVYIFTPKYHKEVTTIEKNSIKL